MIRGTLILCASVAFGAGHLSAQQARPPLGNADVTAIAELLKIEDTRRFDELTLIEELTLTRLIRSSHPEVRRRAAVTVGRVVNEGGLVVLEPLKTDADPEIVATAAFAMGQLKNPAAVEWLTTTMNGWRANAPAAFEAARALGKVRSPEARVALDAFVTSAPADAAASGSSRRPAIRIHTPLPVVPTVFGAIPGRRTLSPAIRRVSRTGGGWRATSSTSTATASSTISTTKAVCSSACARTRRDRRAR